MGDDLSSQLIEEIIDAIAFGATVESLPSFRMQRRDPSVVEMDFGNNAGVYRVTVSRVEGQSDAD
jgi:hypothetical protein